MKGGGLSLLTLQISKDSKEILWKTLDSVDNGMDKLLKRYKAPKLTQEDNELSEQTCKNFYKSFPHGFTSELYQKFKGKIISNLHTLPENSGKKNTSPIIL